jgi:heme-degrading monooxygenase HmoA
MIQVVWQYLVKEEARAKFELAYGPGGAWSDLFSTSPGFRGAALLRDTSDPRKYLTFDSWDSEADRQAMLAEHQDEYAALDAAFKEWTESGSRGPMPLAEGQCAAGSPQGQSPSSQGPPRIPVESNRNGPPAESDQYIRPGEPGGPAASRHAHSHLGASSTSTMNAPYTAQDRRAQSHPHLRRGGIL